MRLIQMFQESPTQALIYILSIFLAMCIGLSFHECAHAWTAYKLGDPTAKNMGRMTLDPLKHIDLLGMLCFVLFGIGWAKPVMIGSRNLKNFRRDDVLISLAGPVTNLLLSFVFYGIYFFLQPALMFRAPVVLYILATIYSVNISLAIFNVLPIPPLDGFHVVTSLFVRKSYKVVEFLQRYGYWILLILLFTGVLDYILTPAINWFTSLYYSFFSLFV